MYHWHVPLMMPSRNGTEIEAEDSNWEDRGPGDARTSPDVWKADDKVTVPRNDLRVTTQAIYLAH